MKKRIFIISIVLAVALVSFVLAFQPPPPLLGSQNVVIIGGSFLDVTQYGNGPNRVNAANFMGWTYGGFLCINSTIDSGAFSGFNFTAMPPANVNAVNLAAFDTAVLNVASYAMQGTTATLSAGAKQALVDFVAGGKKLIIYDSEVYPGPVDYSWLPYPFTTSNPGALGQKGTLTVVEDSSLASNVPASPFFISAVDINTYTDAVGDMNVMVTLHPEWRVNMSGTNFLGTTGPVHTYARYGTVGSVGLIIYNGLDMDYQQAGNNIGGSALRKIWLQELNQPFNPDNLPGNVAVVGITLNPATASLLVGDTHTLTANVTDLLGNPRKDILTTITVISGPNIGQTGSGLTNANGDFVWSYIGKALAKCNDTGQDIIEAEFSNMPPAAQKPQVTANWTQVDKTAPAITYISATPNVLWPPNHKYVNIVVDVTATDNCDPVTALKFKIVSVASNEPINGLGDGDTAPDWVIPASGLMLQVRAERSGTGTGRVYTITVECRDSSGNVSTELVNVTVPHNM